MLSPQSVGFHLRVRPELGQSVATGRCFLGQDVVAQWRSLSVSLGRGIPLAWLLHACFLNRKSLPLGGQVRPKQNCLYPKPLSLCWTPNAVEQRWPTDSIISYHSLWSVYIYHSLANKVKLFPPQKQKHKQKHRGSSTEQRQRKWLVDWQTGT